MQGNQHKYGQPLGSWEKIVFTTTAPEPGRNALASLSLGMRSTIN